ncbi:MAG: hypothetical protein LBC87_06325 [Fibromonadaceae bacterium]|jgi:hypothetical protein|nr:hypothetical protein [Fibromonadaceae bacterium]
MKNAKLALVATLGLALTFTFSCSSGGGSDGGGNAVACRLSSLSVCWDDDADPDGGGGSNGCREMKVDVCQEISGEEASKYKDELKEECEDKGGKFYDSCPSGYKLKCNLEGYSIYSIYYIYDKAFNNCDDFFNW